LPKGRNGSVWLSIIPSSVAAVKISCRVAQVEAKGEVKIAKGFLQFPFGIPSVAAFEVGSRRSRPRNLGLRY